jgi:phage terminase large subunit GpA-like protein
MSGGKLKPVEAAFRRARQIAIPVLALTVSMWAAAYRRLAAERAAAAGRWRNELVPYLVEIMDTVGKPAVSEIVFVKSSQVGGSEFLNNVVGYYSHIEPSPILYVAENQDKAEAWSKESLSPTIRDTPVLASLYGDTKMRDSGNTIEGKSFPGGHLAIAWATSPATLSSRPRRVVLMDERDAFEPTKEGDPAKLAEKRAVTYKDRKVIIKVSTPRNRLEPEPGAPLDAPRFSPIELEYENSDQRKYFVPCPQCGEYQVLVWKNVRFEKENPLAAVYMCEPNGCVIEHESKTEMLSKGEWRAEKEFTGRAGFLINELYSPFSTWGDMAKNFLEAKKSQAALRVFINTSLAEGWEELPEKEHTDDLASRREPFEAEVPDGVLVITASADVQGDRLETELVGWGLDGESWSLKYEVLEGDPAQQKVWDELKELWTTPLHRADGTELRVRAACVDSGGHHTQRVYRFCRQNKGRRWFAVKGANTPGKPLVSKFTLQGRPPVRLYTIGTETAKDEISSELLITEPGPGYMHFPEDRDESYFKQLRSERPVTRYMRGKGRRQWEKIRQSARNEALDLRVYAKAALAILRPDFRLLQRRRAEALAEALKAQDVQVAAVEEAIEETPDELEEEERLESAARRPARRRRRGFVHNW